MTSVHAPSSSGPAEKVVCAPELRFSAPSVIADQLIVEGLAGSENPVAAVEDGLKCQPS